MPSCKLLITIHILSLVISAKEVTFYPAFYVCLFVRCLLATSRKISDRGCTKEKWLNVGRR